MRLLVCERYGIYPGLTLDGLIFGVTAISAYYPVGL